MEKLDLGNNSGELEIKEKSISPKIRMEFFRHDAKGASRNEAGEKISDQEIRLSEQGRINTTELGKHQNPHPETALVYGSPRERTTESAYRRMLANNEGVTKDTALEEMREMVKNSSLETAKKEISTPNLDFNWEGSEAYAAEANKRYNEGDLLVFLWKDSDRLANELGDTDSDTYSRFAGKVAELVKKYISIFPTWDRITSKDPEKYKEIEQELQRFLGTHQDVAECFLMKIIEKTEGESDVENFLNSLDSKNGFGPSEGCTVEIQSDEVGIYVDVIYKDKKWRVNPDIIDEIVEEK